MTKPRIPKRPSAGGTPAIDVLQHAGVEFTLHPYDHDEGAPAYGEEAATALGVEPTRIFKTLVAELPDGLVVAVVPVAGSLDLRALASALGAKRAAMADPAAATRSSGYVLGGISPLGQRTPLRTVVDASALDHATVFVSAGRRGLSVQLHPGDLIRLTRATTSAITRT